MMRYLFLLSWCLAGTVRGEDVTVLDFGAVPDGKTLTTASLQNAIDHCSRTGGGTVTVPPGTYLTHTVYLTRRTSRHSISHGRRISVPGRISSIGAVWRRGREPKRCSRTS